MCLRIVLVVFFLLLRISVYSQYSQHSQYFIHINQLGYYENSPKSIMLTEMTADEYTIRDAKTDKIVYSGMVGDENYWNLSGENLQIVDFSDFKTPGNYYVQIGSSRSYPFFIKKSGLYDSLSVWTNKAFYLWRASCPIDNQYAKFEGVSYARNEGHPDTIVYVHLSAANEKHHAESEVCVPKGWYDSSDYGKYIVNAGFSVQLLSFAYEVNSKYYASLDFNIPESNNKVPDILDEIKWELDWMLSMQDDVDGSVYFKVSSLGYTKQVMPDKDTNDRYVIGKSTSSALNFAACMAIASRLYAPYDSIYHGFSKKALRASIRAYQWALNNPKVIYRNSSDVSSGEYYDDNLTDEFFWASAQLLLATKEKMYYDNMNFNQSFDSPLWNNTASLGLIELKLNENILPQFVDKTQLNVKFKFLIDNIYKQYYYSVGKIPLKKFEWGSNGTVAANSCILCIGYKVFHNDKYIKAAISGFDYLLGRNSLDYCFVTRFGSHYPRNIRDKRSASDAIYEPLPGYLCGGPNKELLTDCGQQNYPTSIYPARSYLDEYCSYSTNDIAINWNAPMVLLTGCVINYLEQLNK